eukprot:Pompholyxophrys_punicea_v1_NODE_220_length_2711_cov_7.138178.p3 type:complete len:147 gc:universal NODE_220_length_2711_cov_7.138178:467-907(+)
MVYDDHLLLFLKHKLQPQNLYVVLLYWVLLKPFHVQYHLFVYHVIKYQHYHLLYLHLMFFGTFQYQLPLFRVYLINQQFELFHQLLQHPFQFDLLQPFLDLLSKKHLLLPLKTFFQCLFVEMGYNCQPRPLMQKSYQPIYLALFEY